MQTATLFYWDREYTSVSSKILSEKNISGKTDINIFEEFYRLNNSLRYCNGSYYTFKDGEWEIKYKQWLKSDDYKKKSFNLFYNGSYVD